MKPLGLGMIGLHHQHPRWYSPLWSHLPEYELRAMAEPDEAFLASEKEFFSGLDACGDYRELLARDDIDAVIVWSPHSEMPQVVADAAAAGKHAILEKPCCADVAGAERIVQIAAEHPDVVITSPYCWRTHPVSAEIRKAYDAGLLGDVLAMEGRLNAGGAHRYVTDNALWMLRANEGGGPMWNLGVHWIDYFRWLTGCEVVRVSGAVSGPAGEPERDIEDSAQAVLTFDSGATAILDISYGLTSDYPGKRDIYVAMRGTLGAFAWAPAWQCLTDELLLVSEHASLAEADRCREIEVASRDIPGYCGNMAWQWLKDFAAACRGEDRSLPTAADILAAVQVADAFYRSVTSGRAEAV